MGSEKLRGHHIWLVVSTCFNPSEKYESQLDYYSQYMESYKIHVPNHQADIVPSK